MIATELLVILLCMVGAAFFAGIETGVISIHRLRLRHLVEKGHRWACVLQEFLDHPDRLLGTTLIGVNICMVGAAVLAAKMGHDVPVFGRYTEALSGAVLTILILVLCEYIPKAWFQSDPLMRCRPFAGVLQFSAAVLRPLSAVMNAITGLFIPPSFDAPKEARPFITRDEIDILARESEEHGNLSPRQRIMIHRVVELAAKTAGQVMVPRARIVSVDSHAACAEFLRISRESTLTRLPVLDAAQGRFIGVVNLFDVLARPAAQHGEPVSRFMRAPLFIPEGMPLTEIFPRLRASHQPLCLITSGSSSDVVGLLTTEDILQSVVGTL